MAIRERRKREQRRRVWTMVVPIVILVAALAVIMVWKVFVVKEVEVVGNEIYTSEQIENWALDDEYSWNSLYVVLKNKFQKQDEIPFVESMEISLKSPSKIQIKVVEKGVLGYLYVPSLGQNAYFDKDGFVVELSNNIIDGTIKITGLSVESATLYEKLDIDNSSILKTLLSLTQLLKKYERTPEIIYVQDSNLLLSYGQIQVDLGTGTSLNEKILRMDQILPQLEGQTGTLHLDTWSESSTDIYFKQNALTEIPADVQTVPGADVDDSTEAEDTTDDAGAEDTTDDAGAEDTTDDAGAEDTTDDAGAEDTTDDAGAEDTTDDAGVEDTTDNAGAKDVTDDAGAADAGTVSEENDTAAE